MAEVTPLQGDLLHLPATLCLSIGVRLRLGDGPNCEHPPERRLAASPRHTFADLAIAIDEAFGRWELGHRREFALADGTRLGEVADDRKGSRRLVDYRRARLHRLQGGEPFTYTFESGERWLHECVLVGSIDPDEVLADRPGHPVAYQPGRPTPDAEVRRRP